MLSAFRYSKVAKNVIRVNSFMGITNEYFYLVLGTHRAALIDTGYGIGDLRKFVSAVTDRPCIVLNTHGHPDHVGGNCLFDEVHLHPDDQGLLELYSAKEVESMVENLLCEKKIWFDHHERLTTDTVMPEIIPLHDGEIFDLGGVTLETIAMPGHSPGSVSFLYKEEKILFSGDNCGPQPLLAIPEQCSNAGRKYSSLPLETFFKSLIRINERKAEIQQIFNCHKSGELPISCFEGVLEAVEGVLLGKYRGVPTSIFQGKVKNVFSARGLDPELVGITEESFCGDVIFAKDNLWE